MMVTAPEWVIPTTRRRSSTVPATDEVVERDEGGMAGRSLGGSVEAVGQRDGEGADDVDEPLVAAGSCSLIGPAGSPWSSRAAA